MPPQQLPPEDDNVELEAIAQNGLQANESLDNVDANTEAAALKLNEMEQNQEAQLLQGIENNNSTNKIADSNDQIARNTDPSVPRKVELESTEEMSKIFFSMIKGRQGETGPQGPVGPQGIAGVAGPQGNQGPAGPQGPEGPEGPAGADGENGKDGKDGKDGKNGKDGKDGKDANEKKIVETVTKVITKDVTKESKEVIDKEFESVKRYIQASKSYSTGDLTDTAEASTGQVMTKQADGSWAPSTPSGAGDMVKSVYDTDDDGVVDSAEKVEGVDAASNNRFYGKNGSGVVGFHAVTATEVNDLTTSVTWANVPDANITESSVTQHEAALSITESQISDLGTYQTQDAQLTSLAGLTPGVEGRMITSDGLGGYQITSVAGVRTYLNVEDGATADQTGAEIKSAYEAEANTNAFTDAEKTKLSGIEASADVTDTANVTAAGALMDSEVTNLAQVKAFDSSDYATAAQGTTADSALQPNTDVVVTDIEITGEFGADAEVDDGNSSTADTINWTTGNFHKSTMTGNCTYTFTSPTNVGRYQLMLVQDATGSRIATWPASVKWPSGTAPTLSTAASSIDIITFYFDGTNFYGVDSLAFA